MTSADLEADAALREHLSRAFPDYGWLSEETADNAERLSRRRVWIVDPLDGTAGFIKGIPEFVVAIALAEDGVPVLGVTYNPIKRELFWAARGAGCYLDDSPVHVTAVPGLAGSVVLASRSETARGEWRAYKDKFVAHHRQRRLQLALVAAGKADGTFTATPKSEWDIASGAAMLAEAGGVMTDIHGDPIRFNRKYVKLDGFVAAGPAMHAALSGVNQKIALDGRAGIPNRRINRAGGAAAAGNQMAGAGARRCAARRQILRSPLPHTSKATSPTR